MTLVKHSKRTTRSGCKKCKNKDLYFAHDTEDVAGDSGYCPDCKVNGRLVLINRDGTRHECEPKPKPAVPKPLSDPFDPRVWFTSGGRFTPGGGLYQPTITYPATPAPPRGVLGLVDFACGDFAADEPFEVKRDQNTGEITVTKSIEPSQPKAIEPRKDETVPNEADALNALRKLLSPDIDRAAVEKIAREVVADVVYPTRTVVIKDADKKEISGNTHRQLGDLIAAVSSGEHVMMVGPAGTGKSHMAQQAAEAVGLASYSISLSPQTPASALLGYMQAAGEYVSTLFRKAYESGGLFHFDEVDNAHPSVLAVVNSALANGHMAFPDKMVARHDDFLVVASANTYGRGATRAYVGRQQLDAATLDRFTMITIDIDEALENALAHGTGASKSTVGKVLKYVRALRKNAETNGLNVVLSPRASVGMCRLLHAGMNWDQAVDARLRRGIDQAAWDKLSKGVTA